MLPRLEEPEGQRPESRCGHVHAAPARRQPECGLRPPHGPHERRGGLSPAAGWKERYQRPPLRDSRPGHASRSGRTAHPRGQDLLRRHGRTPRGGDRRPRRVREPTLPGRPRARLREPPGLPAAERGRHHRVGSRAHRLPAAERGRHHRVGSRAHRALGRDVPSRGTPHGPHHRRGGRTDSGCRGLGAPRREAGGGGKPRRDLRVDLPRQDGRPRRPRVAARTGPGRHGSGPHCRPSRGGPSGDRERGPHRPLPGAGPPRPRCRMRPASRSG